MNNIVLKSFYYSESLNCFVFTLNIIDDYVYYNIVNNSERNKQHMQKKTFLEEFKRIVLKK
jgi:hypothetical protein